MTALKKRKHLQTRGVRFGGKPKLVMYTVYTMVTMQYNIRMFLVYIAHVCGHTNLSITYAQNDKNTIQHRGVRPLFVYFNLKPLILHYLKLFIIKFIM